MILELSGKLFYCQNIQTYTSHENGISKEVARYTVVDRQNENHIFLIECIKESANDFNIRYFEKLEEMEYDPEFMGLVGTSPFGYTHPSNNDDYYEYDKVVQEGEEYIEQEFSINLEDEEDDSYKDYAIEDENGWYYIADRSTGILREFNDGKEVYAWIYDRKPVPELPIYMLIELKALDGEEYETQRPKISVYEGKKILINDIKIV
jgi:hypothetical protein